jgi:hypothetical protein
MEWWQDTDRLAIDMILTGSGVGKHGIEHNIPFLKMYFRESEYDRTF